METGAGRYGRLKSAVRGTLAPYAHRLNMASPYRGHVDGLAGNDLCGWVVANPSARGGLSVGLFAGSGLITSQTANQYRGDVAGAGIGDGHAGFAFTVTADILAAAEARGGQVSVRVLGDPQVEIGTYDLTGAAARNLAAGSPHMQQCRNLLFGDLALLRGLLDSAPAGADPEAGRKPALKAHGALFQTDPVLPAAARAAVDIARLPAYLDYTKLRTRKERVYDTEGNPEDRDHFLHWYITVYAAARPGRRVPLSAALIEHLNAPVVMGGQPHSLSRAMWWRLAGEPKRLGEANLADPDWFRRTLHWWCWTICAQMHAEDCLVPRRFSDALRVVPVHQRNDGFALSWFMQYLFQDNSQYNFLDISRAPDRQLFTLMLAVHALQRPDILRYIPNRSIEAVLERPAGRASLLETFVQGLLQLDRPPALDRARYGAMLRLRGYDLYSQAFVNFTPEGHRLDAAARLFPQGPKEVDVQLIGPFEKASGLGQATRLSASIMAETGLSMNCVDFGLDNPAPEGFSRVGALGGYKAARVNLIHLNAESIPLVFAYEPDVFSDSYNIGYFFWELSEPALCHYLGMELLDEIWVSSDYGVRIYSEDAKGRPVVNVGMCYEELAQIDRAAARDFVNRRFRIGAQDFVFLVAFDSFSFVQRKNPIGVLQAFQRAFEGVPGVRLILKTQNRDNVLDPVQARIWNQIEALMAEDSRILLMNETLAYDRLLQLKAASDCYISLHKSEGWGFGMIEAMSLKVPVVCTAYSGNLEFCSDATAWMVEAREVSLHPDEYIFVRPGSVWGEPDPDQAVAVLRAVHADPEGRAARAEAAFRNVRENFSAQAVARRYRARLDAILPTLA